MLFVFAAVRRHYHTVAVEIAQPVPLDVGDLQEPIVIVPLSGWNRIAHKALRFALKLSSDIHAVHVHADERPSDLPAQWERLVAEPTRRTGLPSPRLVVIESAYRRTLTPIFDYVMGVRDRHPDRQIAVLIPELVESRWYHSILHNHRAQALKAMLLFHGGQRVVVIDVPWYLAGTRQAGSRWIRKRMGWPVTQSVATPSAEPEERPNPGAYAGERRPG
jgi:hypothetical protein